MESETRCCPVVDERTKLDGVDPRCHRCYLVDALAYANANDWVAQANMIRGMLRDHDERLRPK